MDLPVNYNAIHYFARKLVREEYGRRQGGMCKFCNKPLDVRPKQSKQVNWDLFPPNFLKWPVHLHHDHDTGLTIGAVHAYCNAVLWEHHGE